MAARFLSRCSPFLWYWPIRIAGGSYLVLCGISIAGLAWGVADLVQRPSASVTGRAFFVGECCVEALLCACFAKGVWVASDDPAKRVTSLVGSAFFLNF